MTVEAAPVVVCIGDVVDDVVVRLDGDLRPSTDTPARIVHRRGGSAANVAAAVVAAGGRARLVANVGAGAVAEGLAAGLRADGVEVLGPAVGPPATIVVVVDATGERSMLTDRGAAPDLAELPPGWDDDVGALHLPGYSLFGGHLAATARRAWDAVAGVRTVSTAGVGLVSDVGAGPFRDLLAALDPDVVVANGPEADALDLVERPVGRAVVVTAGPGPVLVVDGAGRRHRPVDPLPSGIDTTGAGDAFTGGLLAALTVGAALDAAVDVGARIARTVLSSRPR